MIWRAILFWLFSTGAVLAGTVTVRTGEHATFSRVVLALPSGVEWRLGRDDSGYVIRLSAPVQFDTSRFFDLIPRDRIAAVQVGADGTELRLRVACKCNAVAFDHQGYLLVVDVGDGPPAPGGVFEQPLDPPGEGIAAAARLAPYVVPRAPVIPVVLPAAAAAPVATEQASVPASPGLARPDVSAVTRTVSAGLAQAVAEGLLDPAANNELSGDESVPFGSQFEAHARLRTVTGSVWIMPPDPALPAKGMECLPDEYFDIAAWGDTRPFAAQIGDARGRVTGEFDKIDLAAVTDLARRYLYFGFGREAATVLGLIPGTTQEKAYLGLIAEIIDGDTLGDAYFADQRGCSGYSLLWALLAETPDQSDPPVDGAAALRALKALPDHLQSHLGPLLAGRLVTLGETVGAEQALASVRAEEIPSFSAELAETEITRSIGDAAGAAARLEELAATDKRMTPQAMTARLHSAINGKLDLDDADFLLADALRFEAAGTPAASDLAVAQFAANLHMNRFDAASILMAELAGMTDPPDMAALQDAFAHAAVLRMEDLPFLDFAFSDVVGAVARDTEDAIATRLLDLGFPDRAVVFTRGAGPDRAYLRAQIALALGNPDSALAHVAGLDSARGADLRKQAEDMRKRDLAATGGLPVTGEFTGFWLQSDGGDLSTADDALRRTAQAEIAADEPGTLKADAPLADGRALLDRSAESRALVDALLGRFPAPADF